MDVAGDSQTLAAAVNHASLNIGNSLGAALGGVVVAAGLGYLSPVWLGLGLAALGVIIAIISVVTHRRSDSKLAGRLSLQQNAVLDGTLS
jgi:DHA1 family inner membrane transport protein